MNNEQAAEHLIRTAINFGVHLQATHNNGKIMTIDAITLEAITETRMIEGVLVGSDDTTELLTPNAVSWSLKDVKRIEIIVR